MIKRAIQILGLDIGSVGIHAALISGEKLIKTTHSVIHEGEIKKALDHLLNKIDLKTVTHIAVTDATPDYVRRSRSFDDQLSIVRAGRFIHPSFDAILHVGGEKFSLSRFDRNNKYIGAGHNTSCAAGTGSFLDQQARRLDLESGSKQLSKLGLRNNKDLPQIATRCAVFAKTDLIHAQQEGFGIDQICDGLCYGLAKNLAATLFKNQNVGSQIIFCGGVAKNDCVVRHLEKIVDRQFIIDPYACLYGAIGAGLCMYDAILEDDSIAREQIRTPGDLFIEAQKENILSYPPLTLKKSVYPEFNAFLSFEEQSVESDIYINPESVSSIKGFIGIDVGSTSTKSILIDENDHPVAGFYTKTASRPVRAVQKILQAFDSFFESHGITVTIQGCGTTGSGRRISAKIIGADVEPDEITAHATAACHINPDVDTIIEIGGQDAKFTTLKKGIVTSSVMNTVCAAGTGSFIEEQALKLGCPLDGYAERAENVAAPMASDRCTVFMERDINHYFAQGFTKNEVLASVLHSVRDNYLTKVANTAKIGNCVLFQGATAKNRALIAAFEQKLDKPIHVSRFCHLTGALGVALLARDKFRADVSFESQFKGFHLWRSEIPVRQEVCTLCQNNCKLTIANIEGQDLAYGFLCGRDYDTQRKVTDQSKHNLLRSRKKAVPELPTKKTAHDFTIGIPQALHLFEDHAFWQYFFKSLGVKTVSSSALKKPVKEGKTIVTAEFCAPLTALHGHIKALAQKADYVFLPFYFEEKSEIKNRRRQLCYYSQFSPAVLSCLSQIDENRLVRPVIKYLYTSFYTKIELYRKLKTISDRFSFFDISNAFDKATSFNNQYKENLCRIYREKPSVPDGLNVVFLGRPYTVLSKQMNNNIPTLFENLGAATFFQDMLDYDAHDFSSIDPLLNEIHWKYAAQILKGAFIASKTKDLYPVFISSFRCAPDSFAIDYFKQIMDQAQKPYLVLELDEHDSSVGYETRVEAAVRAFKNHQAVLTDPVPINYTGLHPKFSSKPDGKTMIFPNWDSFSGALIVSTLKNEGYDAYLMEETNETLKKSLLTNTGQCIPLNAVASAFIHTVESKNLNPGDCVLWLNPSEISCNIKLYPYHIKKILTEYGNGFEHAQIYKGELSLFDISFKASTNAYFAYMFGGLLRSIGCKLRPYEKVKGATDAALEKALNLLCNAFEHSGSKEAALASSMALFKQIPTHVEPRPKVGIFGDLYVRDNDIMNQDLIRFIEYHGGEVITTPYYKYIKIIANSYFRKWFKEGKYFSLISNSALLYAMQTMEKRYYKYIEPVLGMTNFNVRGVKEDVLLDYGLVQEHTGESMDNILKIHHLINEHPDLSLLVQTSPSFCCPAMITEAMARKIEDKTGVPVISITYDVSGGNKNKVIIPFLKNAGSKPFDQSQSLKVSV